MCNFAAITIKQKIIIMRKTFKSVIVALFVMMGVNNATAQSWTADNGNGTYTNPLFYDEFSDPDVIRVGEDYYFAGTTMHCLPGVVVLHSKDLVNWKTVSYVFPSLHLALLQLHNAEFLWTWRRVSP